LFYFKIIARLWWLTPVILSAQEAEIRKIMVQSQTRQTICEALSGKKKKKNHTHTQKGWWRAQAVGPEFKPRPSTAKTKQTPPPK
jgi:hypothetical protein